MAIHRGDPHLLELGQRGRLSDGHHELRVVPRARVGEEVEEADPEGPNAHVVPVPARPRLDGLTVPTVPGVPAVHLQ